MYSSSDFLVLLPLSKHDSRHKLGHHLIHKQFMRLGGDRNNDRVGEAHFLNAGVDIPFDPWDT